MLPFHPREIQILWSQTDRAKPKQPQFYQGKARERLAYPVREHNKTSQTGEIGKKRRKKERKKNIKKGKQAERFSDVYDARSNRLQGEHVIYT